MTGLRPSHRAPLPEVSRTDAPKRIAFDGEFYSVSFHGNDDRRHSYDTKSIPLSALHHSMCVAFAEASGFDGNLRTERSATGSWRALRRFVVYLSRDAAPPRAWSQVIRSHVTGFERHRSAASSSASAAREMHVIRRILSNLPPDDELAPEVRTMFYRRWAVNSRRQVSGYDDPTFRSIVNAAKADIRRIVKRIEHGESLVEAWKRDPSTVPSDSVALAKSLALIDGGSSVRPEPGSKDGWDVRHRIARNLYLTYDDLTPLLVLLVAVSSWNSETVKELPSAHQVHDSTSVSLEVTKRRRGAGRWVSTEMWEIGYGSRELDRPGSLFLLAHRLTERARMRCGTDRLWAVWTNGPKHERAGSVGTHFAWQSGLAQAPLHLSRWAKSHGLTERGAPLRLELNRVRTSALVRMTRQLGGHLPSAARSNTQDVLFSSYLQGDTTVREWAADVVEEAFEESEAMLTRPMRDASRAEAAIDTGYLSCRDVKRSPFDHGGSCSQSALVCFACPNAVVGEDNLPALLQLRGEIESRYEALPEAVWLQRYGSVWATINERILPRFAEGELERARSNPATTTPPLRFLEDRWAD